MLVRGMLNPEHSNGDYMVEFADVRNLTVYGVKSETLGAGGPRRSGRPQPSFSRCISEMTDIRHRDR